MKIAALIISLIFTASSCFAQWDFDNSPNRVFDMKKNLTNRTTLILSYTTDVQKACEAKSRELGHGGFGYGVIACSWFYDHKCIVIVPEQVEMRTIGHEILHCLQGNWHN